MQYIIRQINAKLLSLRALGIYLGTFNNGKKTQKHTYQSLIDRKHQRAKSPKQLLRLRHSSDYLLL